MYVYKDIMQCALCLSILVGEVGSEALDRPCPAKEAGNLQWADIDRLQAAIGR